MENDSELIGERIEIPRDGKASVKANLYVPDSIGDERSEYGLGVIKKISKELTQRYGKGYDRSNLYHCLKFYKTFPEIVDTACRQSGVLLSWSHYRTLLQVKAPEARDWYEKEAAEQNQSIRIKL